MIVEYQKLTASSATMRGSSRRHSQSSYRKPNLNLPEAIVRGYFTFLPLLWLCGLTLPAAFLLFVGIFAVYVRNVRGFLYAAPWFAVGGAQILSVIINWFASNQSPAILLKHFAASYVSGWLLLGCAIGIGASGTIRRDLLLSSIVRLSYYSIALAIPAYLLAFALPQSSLFFLSPVGHFIPSSFAAKDFSFGIFVYNWEDLGGIQLPRLSILSPWPTAMGAAGVCMAFIADNVNRKWPRRWAVGGAIVMVLASVGRLALLVLVFCGIVRWALNLRTHQQIIAACALGSCVTFGMIYFGSPAQITAILSDRFDNARAGASEVRDEVYEASWRGIRKRPWVGHGWPGESLVDNEQVYERYGGMQIGSHSTVSGLLYKGGVITFAAFLVALSITFYGVVGLADPAIRRASLTILLAIGLTCFGEGLESLALPMIFAFVWIGGAVGSSRTKASRALF